jgi:hypothetical protein
MASIENIDLSQEIESWKSAVYGKDVRAANVAAFEKIQGTVNDTVQNVNQAAEDSASAAHNAQAAVDSIQAAIVTATEKAAAAATSATQAAGSQEAADSSKTAAAQSATDAITAKTAAEAARDATEHIAGFDGTAASVKATDTYGLVVDALGESTTQDLIDAVANKVINELIAKSNIVNNLLATEVGTVLSGALGPIIDQRLTDLMNKYTQLNGEMKQDSFNLENKPVEQTDLNAIYSGVHRYSNLSKNIPSAYNGYIIVMKRGGDTLGQIALDDSGTLYSRVCNDLSWVSWK